MNSVRFTSTEEQLYCLVCWLSTVTEAPLCLVTCLIITRYVVKILTRWLPFLLPLQIFHDVAYHAHNREDLLAGIDEFLDQVTVLPPGEWDPSIRIEPPKSVPSQVGAMALPFAKFCDLMKLCLWSVSLFLMESRGLTQWPLPIQDFPVPLLVICVDCGVSRCMNPICLTDLWSSVVCQSVQGWFSTQ